MYFEDLSPYAYDRADIDPAIVNVGWLSRDHAYPTGGVPQPFVDALRRLVASPVKLHRGIHLCEFCPEPPVAVRNGLRWIDPPQEMRGNGQIRVIGAEGLTYVAPALILHYVAAHRYRPPEAFISAVLAGC